ncbi:MAG: hypothetical protein Q9M30_04425, partial [Mariprofundaceae bacterium]|nr:hypothetical protein [Mariprofundaceae bacterium]
HSFYSDFKDGDESGLQVPVTGEDHIGMFSSNFCLKRGDRCGLSVIIPFPNDDLGPGAMIENGIKNYFYPIIMDQLVLDVGDVHITSENVRELAREYMLDNKDIDEIFDFIFEMKSADEHALPELLDSWSDDQKLDEDDVDEALLVDMRERFAKGDLVGVRLPLTITRKTGEEIRTGFSVFVKRPENLSRGLDLYLRGGLTLPGEEKFGNRKALGALVAGEDDIADFLGDAENAAHTKWGGRAEKLHRNYLRPMNTLRVIKNSIVNLFDMLAQAVEEEDEDALVDFFWEYNPGRAGKARPDGPTPDAPPDTPGPTPKSCVLSRIEGGFAVGPGNAIGEYSFPIRIKVRACYDVGKGNPFRKFNPLDFDFRDKSALTLRANGIRPAKAVENELDLDILQADFRLHVTGFDPNRDLLVKLESVEV